MNPLLRLICLGLVLPLVYACTATESFPNAARAGDTVALALGWNKVAVNRNTIRVTITDALGVVTTINPGDPALRALTQLYPDPVSRLIVEYEAVDSLGGEEYTQAHTSGTYITGGVTGGDKELNETTLFLDLPGNLSEGAAQIKVYNTATNKLVGYAQWIEILPGEGSPNPMYVLGDPDASGLTPGEAATLERGVYSTITFGGTTIPHALQLELSRAVDDKRAWVVNPRGDLKNLAWTDTGSTIKVIMTPPFGATPSRVKNFKFHIAGGVTGLALVPGSLKAYDINGAPVTGVSATITNYVN